MRGCSPLFWGAECVQGFRRVLNAGFSLVRLFGKSDRTDLLGGLVFGHVSSRDVVRQRRSGPAPRPRAHSPQLQFDKRCEIMCYFHAGKRAHVVFRTRILNTGRVLGNLVCRLSACLSVCLVCLSVTVCLSISFDVAFASGDVCPPSRHVS